ncbi:hypothetical protein [Streptomyces sp. NPDC058572]|uniref:hypothetical protein n=1 Tax=Streptomyces sp. NPDC058572 TaxID=3346546 RepID=UPI003653A58D
MITGALIAGYRWTQTQYYIGSKGEHVAIYRGISQDLAWVSLSSVEKDHPEIELKYLPPWQREQIEATIPQDNLDESHAKVDEIGVQVSACKKDEQLREAGDGASDATPGAPGVTLTEEEQKFVSSCVKQ